MAVDTERTMSTIDDLKAKVDRLRDQLRDAQKSYNDARIAEYPIKPGQVFINKKGQRGQVINLEVHYGRITPILGLFNKDGTLGARESVMNHWLEWKAEQ
jgi:hypothetical protein